MTEIVRDVASETDLVDALGPAPVGGKALILIGGADGTEPERAAALLGFFSGVARYCDRTGTAVVDGGTDSGVMRLMGEARAAAARARTAADDARAAAAGRATLQTGAGAFRLIGVAPAGAFERPSKSGDAITLARHHSLILRVPGAWFGDETRWLFAAADHLGGGSAATIVVNGGALTLDEAHQRLASGHTVIAVEGSGRAADALAGDAALRSSGRLRVMPLTADAETLAEALAEPLAETIDP
ncbi:MAG: hypothetical protein ABI620_06780 [Chloroflexota bacterium]